LVGLSAGLAGAFRVPKYTIGIGVQRCGVPLSPQVPAPLGHRVGGMGVIHCLLGRQPLRISPLGPYASRLVEAEAPTEHNRRYVSLFPAPCTSTEHGDSQAVAKEGKRSSGVDAETNTVADGLAPNSTWPDVDPVRALRGLLLCGQRPGLLGQAEGRVAVGDQHQRVGDHAVVPAMTPSTKSNIPRG
jgi:hypothetical protein